MCPMDQLGECLVLKIELFFCNAGNELRTRFAGRIEKFFARRVRQEMLLVRRRQESGLVMIEPPRQTLVGAIFEIDYRVVITVKLLTVKRISRTMHGRCVENIGTGSDLSLIKLCKNGSRRDAVKAVAVIKYPKFHIIEIRPWAKHIRLEDDGPHVKVTSMNIRIANSNDADSLVEFNQAMALETEGKHLDPVTLRSGVEAVFSEEKKGFYVVAESASEIIGGLMVTYEWSDWRNAWFWWIQSVYIRPEVRGQKIYGQLYDFVKKQAAQKGNVCGFRLYVETDNSRAQRVYERVGMEASHYLMYEEEV